MTAGLKYELLNPLTPDGCLTSDQVATITTTLRQSLITDFPHVVVKDQCGPHTYPGNTHVFGVWLDGSESDSAMTAELTATKLLRRAEQFHGWVGVDFLRAVAKAAFAKIPHRYSNAGSYLLPDRNGNITLDGIDLDFTTAADGAIHVVTKISGGFAPISYGGFDIGSIGFTAVIDDTLGLQTIAIDGLTSPPSWPAVVHTDRRTDKSAGSYIVAIVEVILSVGVLLPTILQGAPTGSDAADPGAAVLSVFPSVIPIADGLNLIFDYSTGPGYSVTTSPRGLSLGAAMKTATRQPKVKIHGPTKIAVVSGAPAHASYYAVASEVRSPVQLTWASSSPLNRTSGFVVELDVPTTGVAPGQKLTTSITVTATDADVGTLGPVSDTMQVEIDVEKRQDPHPIHKVGFDPLDPG